MRVNLPLVALPWIAASCIALTASCATGVSPTEFTNTNFDFGFVERVAVLPLESFAQDTAAGDRTTRMLITELLASGAVDVVEPGEVQAALDRIRGGGIPPTGEEVQSLGQTLQVQAVITGSVTQSEVLRSGIVSYPVVTLDLHMLETETGAAVWAATHTEKASGLSTKILGTGAEPLSATTRKCVRQILQSLLG